MKPQNLASHKTTESCSHMTQPAPSHQRCQLYNHSHSTVASNRLRRVSIRLPYENLPYNRSDNFQIYNRITYFETGMHQIRVESFVFNFNITDKSNCNGKINTDFFFLHIYYMLHAQRSIACYVGIVHYSYLALLYTAFQVFYSVCILLFFLWYNIIKVEHLCKGGVSSSDYLLYCCSIA